MSGSGLRQGGTRGNHGIQQRQSERGAHAEQERTTLEMFLGDEHGRISL
jgi:hypothetical protein